MAFRKHFQMFYGQMRQMQVLQGNSLGQTAVKKLIHKFPGVLQIIGMRYGAIASVSLGICSCN